MFCYINLIQRKKINIFIPIVVNRTVNQITSADNIDIIGHPRQVVVPYFPELDVTAKELDVVINK